MVIKPILLPIREQKEEKCIPHNTTLRVKKYLGTTIEQDHRFIKKRIWNMLGLKPVRTATKMIAGIEAMHMIKKGQTLRGQKFVQKQIYLINELLGFNSIKFNSTRNLLLFSYPTVFAPEPKWL